MAPSPTNASTPLRGPAKPNSSRSISDPAALRGATRFATNAHGQHELTQVGGCERARARVEFIAVGGAAAVLHGAPITTEDLDIVHRRTPDNVARLKAVLDDLGAFVREHEKEKLVAEATVGQQLRFIHDDLRMTVTGTYMRAAPNGQGSLTFFSNNSGIMVRLQLDL